MKKGNMPVFKNLFIKFSENKKQLMSYQVFIFKLCATTIYLVVICI